MKYDHLHIPDFVGAEGKCEVCGLEITLDSKDSPRKPFPDIWIVNCPHCDNAVRCVK